MKRASATGAAAAVGALSVLALTDSDPIHSRAEQIADMAGALAALILTACAVAAAAAVYVALRRHDTASHASGQSGPDVIVQADVMTWRAPDGSTVTVTGAEAVRAARLAADLSNRSGGQARETEAS